MRILLALLVVPVLAFAQVVDPTDGTWENGLAMNVGYTATWPDLAGCFVNYMDLYDPAYGLTPGTNYAATIVEYCIQDRDGGYAGCEVTSIIMDWAGSMPDTNAFYSETIDVTGWGSVGTYNWQPAITYTGSTGVLPDEFAFGLHEHWAGGLSVFYYAMDTNNSINWYWDGSTWVDLSTLGYGAAFGGRFTVVVASGIESASIGEIKANFK